MIETDRLTLKILKEEDADDVYGILKEPDISNWIYIFDQPFGKDQANAWCQRAANNFKIDKEYICGAYLKDTPEMIGNIGLHLNAKRPTQAEIGYFISRHHWRRGYASEMIAAIIEFSFSDKDLNTLTATASLDNIGSDRVLIKNGFIRKGDKTVSRHDGTPRISAYFEIKREGYNQ